MGQNGPGHPTRHARRLVLEVPHAGGHKRDAVFIAAVNAVLVPHAAARVRDGCHARLAGLLHGVAPAAGRRAAGAGAVRVRAQHLLAAGSLATLASRQRRGNHTVRTPLSPRMRAARRPRHAKWRASLRLPAGRGPPHLKGKNASLARTEPLTSAAAFSKAISVDLTLPRGRGGQVAVRGGPGQRAAANRRAQNGPAAAARLAAGPKRGMPGTPGTPIPPAPSGRARACRNPCARPHPRPRPRPRLRPRAARTCWAAHCPCPASSRPSRPRSRWT
jgi:hypothetical protein